MAIYASPTVRRLGILCKDATFNQATVGIVPKKDIGFVFIYLTLLSERDNLNNLASGAAQQNLNVRIVRNYEIVVPTIDILSKFDSIVNPIFEQLKSNTIENMKLAQLRDTLLPKLINNF